MACVNGCGRQSFRHYTTCCTHCKSADGPHAADCEAKCRAGRVGYVEGRRAPEASIPVAIRLIRAELFTTRASWGTMSLRASIFAVHSGGRREHVATSPVDWIGDKDPVWNFTAAGWSLPLDGECSLEIVVEHKATVSTRYCGSTTVPIATVLDTGVQTMTLSDDSGDANDQGSITLQVMSISDSFKLDEVTVTAVKPDAFVSPACAKSVSGGTAAIFNLMLANPPEDCSKSYWIGKDLEHTPIERVFYEGRNAYFKAIKSRRRGSEDDSGTNGEDDDDVSKLGPLLKFMFKYLGVVKIETEVERVRKESSGMIHDASAALGGAVGGAKAALGGAMGALRISGKSESSTASTAGGRKTKDLLVIRNLFDGSKDFRMLDLKIGQKTASSGWYGKSWDKALFREVIDGQMTNSGVEGYRVAGFNGKPKSMTTRDPLLHIPDNPMRDREKDTKKAWSIVLGSMPGAEVFRHFMDMHQVEYNFQTRGFIRMPDEVMEICLHEMVAQLVLLAVACRKVTVPQKWVGSSVCLGFDCGHFPPRTEPEDQIRRRTKVHIFDWGRSELNTMASHALRSKEEQEDRSVFWQYYMGGIDHVVFESVRAYHHRFGNSGKWDSIKCKVYDCSADLLFGDDFLAETEFPVEETHGERVVRLTCDSSRCAQKGASCTLTYSMTFQKLPDSARVKGVWQVCIHRAENLPIANWRNQLSDPFFVISALSRNRQEVIHESRMQSTVIEGNVNPAWDETFCLPIAADSGYLATALDREIPGLNICLSQASTFFPPESATDEVMNSAYREWVSHLNDVVGVPAGRANLPGSKIDAAMGKVTHAINEGVSNPLGFAKKAASDMKSTMDALTTGLRTDGRKSSLRKSMLGE